MFEERLLLDVVKTWDRLCDWFKEQAEEMPSTGWASIYIENFWMEW